MPYLAWEYVETLGSPVRTKFLALDYQLSTLFGAGAWERGVLGIYSTLSFHSLDGQCHRLAAADAQAGDAATSASAA